MFAGTAGAARRHAAARRPGAGARARARRAPRRAAVVPGPPPLPPDNSQPTNTPHVHTTHTFIDDTNYNTS